MAERSKSHLRDIRKLFQIPGAVLGVYVTDHCNFYCAHCCTESGPHKKKAFNFAITDEIERFLCTSSDILAFHVSGGEPFLQLEALRRLSALSLKFGLRLGINTNGFWSENIGITNELGNALSGITDFFISFSRWHSQFTTPSRVRAALEIAHARGSAVELMLVVDEVDDATSLKNEIFSGLVPDWLRCSCSVVDKSGRAARDVSIRDRPELSDPGGPCSEVRRPVIMPDGSYLVCCNTVNFRSGSIGLSIGNVLDQPLEALQAAHKQSVFVKVVHSLGPEQIFRLTQGVTDPDLVKSLSQMGKCQICSLLTQSKERLAPIEDRLTKLGLSRICDWPTTGTETCSAPSN